MEEKNMDRAAFLELEKCSKKMRKKLMLILGGVVLCAVILCGVLLLPDLLKSGKNPQEEFREYGEEAFYEPYTGDIMKNEEYLELDRKVYYADGSGMESSIESDNLSEFGKEVIFLYNYLQTIVAGDHVAYNACFNETYFEANNPKGSFYPQMLYGARITFFSRSNDEKGVLVTYKLEYMIHRNDGSFRRDIRSGESRAQYVTLRIDPEICIEKLITHYEVVSNSAE